MALPILTDSDLLNVQKPAQYMGGERGSITKEESEVDLRICLGFPDTYEVGMSHIGLQILYHVLNNDKKIWAERVYQPLPDMEELLRSKGVKLGSLESKRPLCDFDIVGLSLQYELCMSGILSILDLGGIPLLQRERGEKDPLVIGGGPVTYHPEPFADFFDCFLIGDGEDLVPEFCQAVLRHKKNGLSRQQMLRELAGIEGVYVPSLFEPLYEFNNPELPTFGEFVGMRPLLEGYTSIRRRILPTLEGAPYPTNPIVPNIKAVHDRLSVEVMRGCVRGCRFCQAGYLYRPQRERRPEDIVEIVGESLKNSGFEELSLLSLSTADYCSILPLLSALKERFAPDNDLAISFPSTRVDALKPELLQEVQPIRRSGFTIAPEAGTQRLRDVINKGVTDEELMETCKNVFALGWNSIKMYFMIGLPTETDEDLYGIIDIAQRVKALAGRHRDVTVSVSNLVPKPHTPFQWAEQISPAEVLRKQQLLGRELKRYRVNFRYHEGESTLLESVFARGDRQLGRVILRGYELGCRLEGWTEHLRFDLWMQAFEECGIDPQHYMHARDESAVLPWDHISCDIPKRYFLKEWQRALALRTTPDCLTKTCSTCGACDYDAARNILFDRERTEQRLGIVNPAWQPILDLRARGETTDLLAKAGLLEGEQLPEPSAKHSERGGRYNLREYLRTEVESGVAPRTRGAQEIQRLRLRYAKQGIARFLAHLELAAIFFRAARRAALPIAFTQGFNPKPRFSFGPPLQLGLESECEYVDIYLSQIVDAEALCSRLNLELPAGLRAISAEQVEFDLDSVQASLRSQTFIAKAASAASEHKFNAEKHEWRDISVQRERKHKTDKVKLGEMLTEFEISADQLRFTIPVDTQLASIKPYEVLNAVLGEEAILFDLKKVGAEFR